MHIAAFAFLADSVASLPLKVYRKTDRGRVLAGESRDYAGT